jgi:hypothetical protein
MKTLKILIIVLISTLAILSCKKDATTKPRIASDSLSAEIHNLVPDSIINIMKNLGMPIKTGSTPPNMEKIYYADPFILISSNIPSDNSGDAFAAYLVKFYEQNNTALSIKLDYINAQESGTGLGGFISGSKNSFTVFAKVHCTYYEQQAEMLHVISGIIVPGGIDSLYFANFMLNNYGNVGGYWIKNGQGRIIYDSDGFSPEQSTFTVPDKKKSASFLKSVSSK